MRIPISPEQAPEEHYLDDYVEIIKGCSFDDALVFNCGMGVACYCLEFLTRQGRTTFAMIVAMILRRSQMIMAGFADPLGILEAPSIIASQNESKTTLRLVYMLEKGLIYMYCN